MTDAFYKKHNSNWFEGLEGTMTEDAKNQGGGVIKKGETVTIGGKSDGGLAVTSESGVYIRGISHRKVELKDK